MKRLIKKSGLDLKTQLLAKAAHNNPLELFFFYLGQARKKSEKVD